jgi:hypothetical protein
VDPEQIKCFILGQLDMLNFVQRHGARLDTTEGAAKTSPIQVEDEQDED